ncbi:MAG: hypothetical protein IRY94_16150 [Rhodospirillaceae bacterium]|nr:hypothetical protein [Rhodospirillaceae bacterium]
MKKALLFPAVLALWSGAAAAEECIDQVQSLAAETGVSTELPQAQAGGQTPPPAEPAPGGGTDSGGLAESGGVVAPPPVGSDMPVVKPPAVGDDMATAPRIAPAPGQEGGTVAREATNKTQIQSLLVAARQAAEAGDNQGCLDQLQKARALAAGSSAP